MTAGPGKRAALLAATCRVIARTGVRGLRVEEVAREAAASTTLIYYYFRNRHGLLNAAMEFVNERAGQYVAAPPDLPAGERLLITLQREFQDSREVRENSAVWGELRAAAVFDPALRSIVRDATGVWQDDIARLVEQGHADGSVSPNLDPRSAAIRLTALVEGLGNRWLAELIDTATAHALLREELER
ncbi:TetR/AcrR family transcriptional regulator [Amycolatopsis anabasis]|uniref:TetR/AcrR family transcriptional regulator n=1 Tax=Amycolatopsis anabasis TaxID=1840409 RepID=UPI00131D1E54|nr:TetR/AcrR family transcriptional regulator [Amycolatopsis anabasis]